MTIQMPTLGVQGIWS